MQRLKSFVISWTCWGMNRLSDFQHWIDSRHPWIEGQPWDQPWLSRASDHVRWKIEGWLEWAFAIAYTGSREEIRDAFETPLKYCSPIQREVRARAAEFEPLTTND